MYLVAAFIAERPILENSFKRIGQDFIVDLGFKSFAMIPIEDQADAIVREHCSVRPDDNALARNFDAEDVEKIIRKLVEPIDAGKFAFVSTDSFGGPPEYISIALAFNDGRTSVFSREDARWPDTNVSMALKAIGVPEKLDKRLDAFDVLGLGRFRTSERWLESGRRSKT